MKSIEPNPRMLGFAYTELAPGHEAYAPTIASLGGLEPGQCKLMPPTTFAPLQKCIDIELEKTRAKKEADGTKPTAEEKKQ